MLLSSSFYISASISDENYSLNRRCTGLLIHLQLLRLGCTNAIYQALCELSRARRATSSDSSLTKTQHTHTHKMSQETNVPKSVRQYSGQILINKSNCTAAKENFLSHSQEPPGVKQHLAKPTPSITNKQGAFFRLCRDAIWEHKLSEYRSKQRFSECDPASPGPC